MAVSDKTTMRKALGLIVLLGFGLAAAIFSSSASAQSLGAANPNSIGRQYQNLDQIYALAPAVIGGRHPMSATQVGLVRAGAPQVPNALRQPLPPLPGRQNEQPIIEPITSTNWIWIGTTVAASVATLATYLITRSQ